MVGADIPDTNVIAHDDHDVGLLALRRNWNHHSNACDRN
jgi:hypothetical protein